MPVASKQKAPWSYGGGAVDRVNAPHTPTSFFALSTRASGIFSSGRHGLRFDDKPSRVVKVANTGVHINCAERSGVSAHKIT
jgi:hypothetical protein